GTSIEAGVFEVGQHDPLWHLPSERWGRTIEIVGVAYAERGHVLVEISKEPLSGLHDGLWADGIECGGHQRVELDALSGPTEAIGASRIERQQLCTIVEQRGRIAPRFGSLAADNAVLQGGEVGTLGRHPEAELCPLLRGRFGDRAAPRATRYGREIDGEA